MTRSIVIVVSAFVVGLTIAVAMSVWPRTSGDVIVVHASPADATTITEAATVEPTPTTAPATVALRSTAYCLTSKMADGATPHVGVVAANRWPIGTRLRVSDSPTGPGVFVVHDRHRPGATQLDFALPGDCARALAWGRRSVNIEVLP